ncbi:hypothetical protein HAX54_001540, partial [Datura stramonium]|nr:hypothetical protein [Datura stramonium]
MTDVRGSRSFSSSSIPAMTGTGVLVDHIQHWSVGDVGCHRIRHCCRWEVVEDKGFWRVWGRDLGRR